MSELVKSIRVVASDFGLKTLGKFVIILLFDLTRSDALNNDEVCFIFPSL